MKNLQPSFYESDESDETEEQEEEKQDCQGKLTISISGWGIINLYNNTPPMGIRVRGIYPKL